MKQIPTGHTHEAKKIILGHSLADLVFKRVLLVTIRNVDTTAILTLVLSHYSKNFSNQFHVIPFSLNIISFPLLQLIKVMVCYSSVEFVPSTPQMMWQDQRFLAKQPPVFDAYTSSPSSSATSSTATSPRRAFVEPVLWSAELDSGVNWWSEKLAESGVAASQLAVFEDEMFRLLSEKFSGHWYPEESSRGSAFRSISSDFRVDSVITKACSVARIGSLLDKLPPFTTMFINPGKVSLRISKSQWDDDFDTVVIFSSPKK